MQIFKKNVVIKTKQKKLKKSKKCGIFKKERIKIC